VALRFHAIAGAERCRAALWQASNRQAMAAPVPASGPGRPYWRRRYRGIAAPFLTCSWVRPATPIYSRNRQNQSA
jgi:hypothetical protein